MSLSASDLKYEYELRLCEVIEEYTSTLSHENANIFYYKKINLRYAIERQLYFNYINNEKLFRAFVGGRTNECDEHFTSNNDIDLFFASQFLKDHKSKILREKVPDKPYFTLRPLLSNLKFFYLNIARKKKAVTFDGTLVLHIIHPKFFSYLNNILEALGERKIIVIKAFDAPLQEDNNQRFVYLNLDGDLPSVPPYVFSGNTYLKDNFAGMLRYINKLLLAFEKSKPAQLILVEGNAPTDEIVNQVGKKLGIKVICVQQGWSPVVHSGFRNFSFFKMLMWGKGFVDILKKYNPEQKIITVGTHILTKTDSLINVPPKGIAFFLQSIGKIITEKVWSDFLELIRWTAIEYSDHTIYVREHPSSPLTDVEKEKLRLNNIVLADPVNYKLNDIYKDCILSVCIFSTTILESIYQGVIPIILNPVLAFKYNPDIERWNAGIEVNTIGDVKLNIHNLISDPNKRAKYTKGMDTFSTEFFKASSNEAIKNIIIELQ